MTDDPRTTVQAVRVTTADYNGSSWDGNPFSDSPEWLLAAITARCIEPVGTDRDYADFDVMTLKGNVRATAGDWIEYDADGLHVRRAA